MKPANTYVLAKPKSGIAVPANDAIPTDLLIGDKWVQGVGERIAVHNPTDGSVITTPLQPVSDNFGVTRSIDTAPVSRIVSRMAAYSFDPRHIFTVTLANGQIWQQIDGDTDATRWKEAAMAYLATGHVGQFHAYRSGRTA